MNIKIKEIIRIQKINELTEFLSDQQQVAIKNELTKYTEKKN